MSSSSVSIADINELASDIGKECEKLIASFGHESTGEIVAKCISALEMLETMSAERERTACEARELHEKVRQLERGKEEKAEKQRVYEKDIESIEEIWTAEVEGLRAQVKKLKEENRKLVETQHKLLRSTSKSPETSLENVAGTLYAEEYKLNERLKEQLKLKEKELEVRELEVRDLHAEIEELKMSQSQLRRQSRAMESQVKTLYEEREEILAEMNDHHKTFVVLRDHLGMAQLENEDLAWRKCNDSERPRFTMADMNRLLSEKDELTAKVERLERELEKSRKNGLAEPKFKSVQKLVSENRDKFPKLWMQLALESMSAGPLYDTPI